MGRQCLRAVSLELNKEENKELASTIIILLIRDQYFINNSTKVFVTKFAILLVVNSVLPLVIGPLFCSLFNFLGPSALGCNSGASRCKFYENLANLEELIRKPCGLS